MVLNLELRALVFRVVVVERVVDDNDVIAGAHRVGIASDRNAHGVGVIEQVVADSDIAAAVSLVFAGRFHVEIAGIHGIALEYDVGATVAVEPVGVVGITLTWIVNATDVVDRIAADLAVFGLVISGWPHSLKSDRIDADVVVVVHDVVGDREIGHVSIHVHRLALARSSGCKPGCR